MVQCDDTRPAAALEFATRAERGGGSGRLLPKLGG